MTCRKGVLFYSSHDYVQYDSSHVAQADEVLLEHEGHPHHRQKNGPGKRVDAVLCREREPKQPRHGREEESEEDLLPTLRGS